MNAAIWLYDKSRESMFNFFYGLGEMLQQETPLDRKFARAIKIVAQEKKIARGKLMQRTAMTRRDMNQFIETIKDRGDIVVTKIQRAEVLLWRGG